MRVAGVLMPIASLPSNYGIGDFGEYGYQFVDLMNEAGVKLWQILPLNPLGYGNSPYQPYSSYAGDELYISLSKLKEQGLLSEVKPYRKKSSTINYEKVRSYKNKYLRQAFLNFEPTDDYEEFTSQTWVYEYAVYIALKKQNNLVCWNEWPEEQKTWILNKQYDLTFLEKEINYEMFIQYLFYTQWMELKEYANKKDIKIMGDIPIYVGIDSLDVWTNQKCFLLDAESKPAFVAGVPPDYFSETGQRWGNPIYDWEYLKSSNYDFWLKRLSYSSKLFDVIRIDHFRAFDTYWKIPSSCETAVEGEWVEAPGYELFDKIYKELPDIQIVVEDLGDLRPQVHELRDHYNLKGMKVVQFEFDPRENNNNFSDKENLIVYTGTHDNQTIRGWYSSQPEALRRSIRKSLAKRDFDSKEIGWRFVCYAFHSIADLVIVPIQDVLNLTDKGRLNTPGTLGSPNWEWKLVDYELLKEKIKSLRDLINATERNI